MLFRSGSKSESFRPPSELTGYYSEVEFWMGKPSRLHDRVVYKRSDDSQSNWSINRLSP